eukprot:9499418-Pyramimonas_sp.AAC.1
MMPLTSQETWKEPEVRILFSCRGELALPEDQADREKEMKAIGQPEGDPHQLFSHGDADLPSSNTRSTGARGNDHSRGLAQNGRPDLDRSRTQGQPSATA